MLKIKQPTQDLVLAVNHIIIHNKEQVKKFILFKKEGNNRFFLTVVSICFYIAINQVLIMSDILTKITLPIMCASFIIFCWSMFKFSTTIDTKYQDVADLFSVKNIEKSLNEIHIEKKGYISFLALDQIVCDRLFPR